MSGRDAAYNMGQLAGAALVVIAPVAIGYWLARRLSAKRDDYRPVRWPIATGFVISLLMLASQCAAPQSRAATITATLSNG